MHAMSKGEKQWVGLALNGSLQTEKISHVPSNQYWQSEASSNVLQWKTYWWQGGQLELSTALPKIPSSKKSHRMAHLISAGKTEPDGKGFYFTCRFCCLNNHIRTEKRKFMDVFWLCFSPHNSDRINGAKLCSYHRYQWRLSKVI